VAAGQPKLRLYAHDYLGPYFGFLTGWVYWLAWVAIMSAEIVAAATYMRLWVPASWSFVFDSGVAAGAPDLSPRTRGGSRAGQGAGLPGASLVLYGIIG